MCVTPPVLLRLSDGRERGHLWGHLFSDTGVVLRATPASITVLFLALCLTNLWIPPTLMASVVEYPGGRRFKSCPRYEKSPVFQRKVVEILGFILSNMARGARKRAIYSQNSIPSSRWGSGAIQPRHAQPRPQHLHPQMRRTLKDAYDIYKSQPAMLAGTPPVLKAGEALDGSHKIAAGRH